MGLPDGWAGVYAVMPVIYNGAKEICQVHGLDVLDKKALSALMVGRRIGKWVVSSSGPKGFSRFPHEAWDELPNELLWMRRLYVEQYLSQLSLEPSVEVDVQGMLAFAAELHAITEAHPTQDLRDPPSGRTCHHVRLPISKVAHVLLDGPSAPCLNTLSMSSAAVHGHNCMAL